MDNITEICSRYVMLRRVVQRYVVGQKCYREYYRDI
jgi:hypothetical protein